MVVVEGRGLHSGGLSRVTLTRAPGPVTLNGTHVGDLRVVDTERATTVESPRVRTVEHLFAALAGLGIRNGVAIRVEGGELPLVDGGALAWCDALAALGVASEPTELRVVRDGEIAIDRSHYAFEVAGDVDVEVEVEIDAHLERHARWSGDAADFRARIAPARTFALARDVEALAERGLASHVAPESVVVLTASGALSTGRPFHPDEPARHKLLDLVGDLYLYGGPPIGRARASRPGHTPTHAAVRAAIERGILARA
jgi:UDP-3-O-[3-hydroxymyristoyl] N-acetylglucosamine deacetylase